MQSQPTSGTFDGAPSIQTPFRMEYGFGEGAPLELGVQYQEGVIQFQADHRTAALDPKVHGAVARPLIAWRDRLVRASLVGHDSKRYGGVSFGNLSGRVPPFPGPPGSRPFLITGTQTGGRPSLTLSDLCVVTRYDPGSNWVESFGLVRPSSESMTHGVLYDADPAICFVFHGHSPAIWEQARALDLPTSHPAAGYGTPAMCREMRRLLEDPEEVGGRVLVMGGHRDGVLAFGETAEKVGQALLDILSRASASCADPFPLAAVRPHGPDGSSALDQYDYVPGRGPDQRF